MRNTSNNNRVTFLMDGLAFFRELRRQLQLVAAAPGPNANTYVRLGYWAASHNAPLPDPAGAGGNTTLSFELNQVAAAGHDVKVILPGPTWSETNLLNQIAAVAQALNQNAPYQGNQAFAAHFAGVANIDVYLEPYKGWLAGSSQHQKIAIFSINGQRTALVGGINLSSWYLDTTAHAAWNPPYPGMDGIHDTAVMIEGAATDAVEQEWCRRWAKSGRALHQNATVQNVYNNPVLGMVNGNRRAGQATVTIATTNSENWTGRETDIQDLLLSNIQNAAQSIYFENFSFCDPSLVAAVATKLAGTPAFPTFIMTRGPAGAYDYLHYIATAKMALQNCVSVSFTNMSSGGLPIGVTTVARGAHQVWEVQESSNAWSTLRSVTSTVSNRFMEDDSLLYNTTNSRWFGYKTLSLLNIQAINGGLRMFSPVRAATTNTYHPIYLHSKLAMFENAGNASVLVVGSANFNYRSMVYDGEMSAFITGNANLFNAIRGDILGHFNSAVAINTGNWAATAAANDTLFGTNAAVVGQTYIVTTPLTYFTAVPATFPDGSNFTWF
jgi:phosphatidylserine/phosphatidylglycerophosphate/cardiolipin synthase-like enzyme